MGKKAFERYKFDETIRFLTILILMIFCSVLVVKESSLTHDITLLIIGIVSGRHLSSL